MDEPGRASVPGRAALTGVLTSVMTVGTLAPFALAALAPFVVSDLDLSRTGFGSLVTFYFLVGALASSALGSVVDRLGGWTMMLVLIAISVVTFLIMAGASSYAWLLAAMVLAGFANALANPTTNQVIGSHVAPGRRGVIVGIKQSGVPAGAAVSGLGLPGLAVLLGWRPSVLVCAAAMVVLAVTVWIVKPSSEVASHQQQGSRASVPQAQPRIRWLVVYALLMGSGTAVVTTYLVLFAHEEFAMSEAWAGRTLGVVGIGAVVARIVWARQAERGAHPSRVLVMIAVLSAVSSSLFWLAPSSGGLLALWSAVLLVGISASAWNSVGMLAVIDGNDGLSMGRASGNVLAGFFTGNVISPVAVGALIDRTGAYEPAWALTGALFLVAAFVATAEHRRVRRRAALRA